MAKVCKIISASCVFAICQSFAAAIQVKSDDAAGAPQCPPTPGWSWASLQNILYFKLVPGFEIAFLGRFMKNGPQ